MRETDRSVSIVATSGIAAVGQVSTKRCDPSGEIAPNSKHGRSAARLGDADPSHPDHDHVAFERAWRRTAAFLSSPTSRQSFVDLGDSLEVGEEPRCRAAARLAAAAPNSDV
jgi:hypothetical protein